PWKSKRLEKALRSCSARKPQPLRSRASATALDLQQGKSVLIFSLVASWCNGSTRDSESLCLGSNPSEAATPRKSSYELTWCSSSSPPREAKPFTRSVCSPRRLRKKFCKIAAHSSCKTPDEP